MKKMKIEKEQAELKPLTTVEERRNAPIRELQRTLENLETWKRRRGV